MSYHVTRHVMLHVMTDLLIAHAVTHTKVITSDEGFMFLPSFLCVCSVCLQDNTKKQLSTNLNNTHMQLTHVCSHNKFQNWSH